MVATENGNKVLNGIFSVMCCVITFEEQLLYLLGRMQEHFYAQSEARSSGDTYVYLTTRLKIWAYLLN